MAATQQEDSFNEISLTLDGFQYRNNDPIYALSSPSKTSTNHNNLSPDIIQYNTYKHLPSPTNNHKNTYNLDLIQYNEYKASPNRTTYGDYNDVSASDCGSPSMYKNLIVLSLSFLLMFTSFRSIQSLQSSLNSIGRFGNSLLTFYVITHINFKIDREN